MSPERLVGASVSHNFFPMIGVTPGLGDYLSAYCSACFSGNYPIELPTQGRDQLKLFQKVRD